MKTSSLLFIVLSGMLLPSEILACRVELDEEDKTEELFVTDAVTGEQYVDCIGKSKCRGALITGCPVVKCGDSEACNSAQIIHFTHKVLCEGVHSCHRTEMLAAASDGQQPKNVYCNGAGACDYAHISGDVLEQVSCSGVNACRKARIEGTKLVKCHDGSDHTLACEGLSTFETECLYCGKHGCGNHINQCRYKLIGADKPVEFQQYSICESETLIGNCPAELEEELRLELSGKEQIDAEEGERYLRR